MAGPPCGTACEIGGIWLSPLMSVPSDDNVGSMAPIMKDEMRDVADVGGECKLQIQVEKAIAQG